MPVLRSPARGGTEDGGGDKGEGEKATETMPRLNSSGQIAWREEPRPSDMERVREIVVSSGFFSAAEIEVAVELVQERLSKGVESGYYFLFAEQDQRVAGYSCFGPIPCTVESYDIYWIAVQQELRRSGLGVEVLKRVEERIKEMGGKRIYVETSSGEQYQPTRSFYSRCGYRKEATLENFYSPGDHKVIYLRVL
jgi:ribosomal protein S18 acetylase RimI-like enzyme